MSKSVLITGGTGLVGSALIPKLKAKGYRVSILSRSKSMQETTRIWDYKMEYLDPLAFDGVDAIVHLAGAGVADKKWSAQRKEEIYNSRTKTSLLLYNELQKREHHVKTFIAASAIGLYGSDTGNRIVKEEHRLNRAYMNVDKQINYVGNNGFVFEYILIMDEDSTFYVPEFYPDPTQDQIDNVGGLLYEYLNEHEGL